MTAALILVPPPTAPHPAPAAPPLPALLEHRLDVARSHTDRADAKAQVLGAALLAGAAVAVTVGSLAPATPAAAPLALASAVLGLLVLACLGACLWPRSGRTGLDDLPLEALTALLADPEAHARLLHAELVAVRAIVRRKYRWLRYAMVGFAGVVATVAAAAAVAQ